MNSKTNFRKTAWTIHPESGSQDMGPETDKCYESHLHCHFIPSLAHVCAVCPASEHSLADRRGFWSGIELLRPRRCIHTASGSTDPRWRPLHAVLQHGAGVFAQ